MKIVHCCLTFEYVDDMSYQENILPYIHKKLGHEVSVIAGTVVKRAGIEREVKNKGRYTMKNGVEIIRVEPYFVPEFLEGRLGLLREVYENLVREKPDFIFIHEVTSLSILQIKQYAQENPHVRIAADNHNDYYNSAKNFWSYNILHRWIYRWICKEIEPYVETFWGTLPIRCQFLNELYGIKADKISFLPMGIDDSEIPYNQKEIIRKKIRQAYGIKETDFVIVTGGKIDKKKKIMEVIRAVLTLPDNVKILIFGKICDDVKDEYESIFNSEKVIYVGWIPSNKVYKYFFSTDLACFPGGHSVLWEQSVACGLPAVFRYREGMTHVDLGGNCMFLKTEDVSEIIETIKLIYEDDNLYKKMANIAIENGRQAFSYMEIGKKILQEK